MSDKERQRLRLVGKDDLDDMLEDSDDDLYAGEGPTLKSQLPRLSRNKREFAVVPFQWLMDRRWDNVFPARVRLYLYLQYRSHRGAKEVQLTSVEAMELGLDRRNKMRELRWLEAKGLVAVTRAGKAGNATVRVSVARQRGLPK
jgi:hypothetical protein